MLACGYRVGGFKVLASILMSSVCTGTQAADVTLRWDYSASGAAGFVVFCGASSRAYSVTVDVGNTDTCTLKLPEAVTSFCTVSAYDPARVESGYSNEIAIYVPPASANGGGPPTPVPIPPPGPLPGLVAAYAFDEAGGSMAHDASGNNNNGILSNGVAWVAAGRFGGALMFDGTAGVVTVPDSIALQLTTGMTLAAWVNPSVVSNDWRDVIYKGDDNYYLEATSPRGGAPTAGASFGNTSGPSPLPANTWTHVAVTYDAMTLRLYVNSVLVTSLAYTGSLLTSAHPLQIGGDSIYGQLFQGMIDEVRVYNRALTQTEIQTDMYTSVAAAATVVPAPR